MSDLIDRQAAIDALDCINGAEEVLRALPSVQPEILACGEGELNVPDTNVEDMISRQAALDAIMGQPPEPHYPSWYAAQIEKLPAAQPATSCSEFPNGSDDTISRQAAINAALEDVSGERTHEFNAGATRAANRIKQLPSAQPEQVCVANVTLTDEQVKEVVEKAKNAVISVIELEPHWIPCSERLPEENGQYLITVRYKHVDGYEDVYAEHGDWCDGNWDMFCFGHCGEVESIPAWMPLPEPYRGGEK